MPDKQDECDLQASLKSALAEGQRLREEVHRLKAILAQHSIPFQELTAPQSASERYLPTPSDIAQLGTLSHNPAKIVLFRSLFRGREDVYAERWRTKDGTWAYRPAGKKDWQAVLASRPSEHKKVDRQTRTLYAVTDDVIRQHLTGKKTIGTYPLLLDETCWLLAADFDKKTWQEDALAFIATCQRAGVPAYLESHDLETAAMCGSSSSCRSPPFSPAKWAALFSRKPWSGATTWVSTPTTVSSQAKTLCPREASAT